MACHKFFYFCFMEERYFGPIEKGRGKMLVIALVLMFIASVMGFGIDVDQYAQHSEIKIPGWYFYLIFSVDVIIIISLVLIYFYKRAGVFLFPVGLLLHFFFHIYFLNTFIYSDLLAIFFYASIGLLAVIPQWQHYN